MLVWRNRKSTASAVLWVFVMSLALGAASPAGAAGRGGEGGFFDQLLSIFAPPAPAPAEAAPAPQSGNHRDPLYPYSGGKAPVRQSPAYRTVCVRLCDGYYWPVSTSTTEVHFGHDRNTCESSCSQPAKLYYAPPGDSDASQLVGLDGKPYTSLDTAFLYRKALQPQCQCKPAPWSDSEILRHQHYATQEQAGQPQVATNAPAAPVAASEDAPPPVTDGQPVTAAAVAADGAVAANADPLPIVLRPSSDPAGAVAAAVRPKRWAKPLKVVLPVPAPQVFRDPLSFSTETVDGASHRYIPLR